MDDKEKLTKEFEKLDAELDVQMGELEEVEDKLNKMCDNCEELVDEGGVEEFWGAMVHHEDWVCPYENEKQGACDEYLELEAECEKLRADVHKKTERFCELEGLLFPPKKKLSQSKKESH